MYISRSALDEVGLFDAETFGKGYGEENDFCVRATERGMRNVHALTSSCFIQARHHLGRMLPMQRKAGLKALEAKHPGYRDEVKNFIAADPAMLSRSRLDIARLLKIAPKQITLCFTHTLGGGIQRFLRDQAAFARESSGKAILLAVPQSEVGNSIRLVGIDGKLTLPNLPDFEMDKDEEALVQLLTSLPVMWLSKSTAP